MGNNIGYTYILPKAFTYYMAIAFDKGRRHERKVIKYANGSEVVIVKTKDTEENKLKGYED